MAVSMRRATWGGGAIVVRADRAEEKVECGVGTVATVWNGEVVLYLLPVLNPESYDGNGEVGGMAKGLASLPRDRKKALLLADSKAAIVAVRKAGTTGKARS